MGTLQDLLERLIREMLLEQFTDLTLGDFSVFKCHDGVLNDTAH